MAQSSLHSALALTSIAVRVSNGFLKFTSWLLGGFSALIGFAVVNAEKLQSLVSSTSVRHSVYWGIAVLLLHVCQRFMSLIVTASGETALNPIKLPEGVPHPSLEEIATEQQSAVWRPARSVTKNLHDKILNGDVAAPARLLMALAQWQGLFVLLQVVFVCVAVVSLVG